MKYNYTFDLRSFFGLQVSLKKILITTLVSPIILFSSLANAEPKTIDVMVVYTPGVTARYNGDQDTRFYHLLNVTNQAYVDSNVDLQLNMVHSVEVAYDETNSSVTALQDITFAQNSAFVDIENLRLQHGADVVIFYRPYASSQGGCGIAWIGGNGTNGDFSATYQKNYAYSHVAVDTCADYVTSHELGHNMGLAHSRVQDGTGATFPHALGHGENGNFVTIMAYQSAYNVDYTSGKIYKFSSPTLDCNSSPCGIDLNDPTWGADAVHALNITGPQISDYFATVDTTSTSDPEAIAAAEQQLLDAQTNLVNAIDMRDQAQIDYNIALTARGTALQTYYDAYATYVEEYYNVKATITALNDAINAFNASAGQSYDVQYALYMAYLDAYNAYLAAIAIYNNAINAVNQAIDAYYAANANVAFTWQTLQNAEVLVTQAQTAVDEAQLVLSQLQ